MARLRRFFVETKGQDIIEYSLLLSFIAFALLWVVAWGRDPVKGIWTNVNHTITLANNSASGPD